jgi:hypothetical protein
MARGCSCPGNCTGSASAVCDGAFQAPVGSPGQLRARSLTSAGWPLRATAANGHGVRSSSSTTVAGAAG